MITVERFEIWAGAGTRGHPTQIHRGHREDPHVHSCGADPPCHHDAGTPVRRILLSPAQHTVHDATTPRHHHARGRARGALHPSGPRVRVGIPGTLPGVGSSCPQGRSATARSLLWTLASFGRLTTTAGSHVAWGCGHARGCCHAADDLLQLKEVCATMGAPRAARDKPFTCTRLKPFSHRPTHHTYCNTIP